jgi:uncharacterized protein YecE (DUF72 family)
VEERTGTVTGVIRIGTSGWGNPPAQRELRSPQRSHLEHYAACFNCVEINSSFYRLHQPKTYERWAALTDRNFRFCVKIPQSISHDSALRGCRNELDEFVDSVSGLGGKLAALLLQLPPQAEWHPAVARGFFSLLQDRIDVPVVCEPRHPSWSDAAAARLLAQFGISLVCAHPVRVARSWSLPSGIRYHRLHGSPRVYWSSYAESDLQELAIRIEDDSANSSQVWCIFDNTAAGAAWENAQTLQAKLQRREKTPSGLRP